MKDRVPDDESEECPAAGHATGLRNGELSVTLPHQDDEFEIIEILRVGLNRLRRIDFIVSEDALGEEIPRRVSISLVTSECVFLLSQSRGVPVLHDAFIYSVS